MKISDRDKKLLLIILLAAVILLPIFLFIKPKKESIDDLDSQLVTLNERYQYLKGLSEKQPFYESEIKRLNGEREGMIKEFAEGLRQENTIMFLRDIELNFPIEMSSESFTDYVETFVTAGTTDADGNLVGDLNAISTSTTVTYECDYEQVKHLLDYIFTYPTKMSISTINIVYNRDNQKVSGSFVLNEYAFVGTGRSVESVKLPTLDRGNNFTIFTKDEPVVEEEEEAIDVIEELSE